MKNGKQFFALTVSRGFGFPSCALTLRREQAAKCEHLDAPRVEGSLAE